jgi:phosphoglycolate phosphatase
LLVRPPRSSVLVFDLDGTLIDSLPDIHAALAAVLARSGREAPSPGQVRRMIGGGARQLVARAIGASELSVDAELDRLLAEFLATYEACVTERTFPYPGVPELIAALRDQGRTLTVCTNKPIVHTRRILEATGLADAFAAVVGGDELPFRKPDPRHLQVTLDRAGRPGAGALMIGDGEADLGVARAAGIPVVAVAWGYSDREALSGADWIADSPLDLLELC